MKSLTQLVCLTQLFTPMVNSVANTLIHLHDKPCLVSIQTTVYLYYKLNMDIMIINFHLETVFLRTLQHIQVVFVWFHRCYGHCLKLVPESGSIWHDLGLTYFYQSEHSEESVPKQTFAETAIKAIKQAITLDPSNHLYWNTLGVITASNGMQNRI